MRNELLIFTSQGLAQRAYLKKTSHFQCRLFTNWHEVIAFCQIFLACLMWNSVDLGSWRVRKEVCPFWNGLRCLVYSCEVLWTSKLQFVTQGMNKVPQHLLQWLSSNYFLIQKSHVVAGENKAYKNVALLPLLQHSWRFVALLVKLMDGHNSLVTIFKEMQVTSKFLLLFNTVNVNNPVTKLHSTVKIQNLQHASRLSALPHLNTRS